MIRRISLVWMIAAIPSLCGCTDKAGGPTPVTTRVAAPILPSPAATWPWPRTEVERPCKGVTHWVDRSPADGTVLDLFEFDFRKNPNLRLELYDQDEDDQSPYDDVADYWPHSVAWATYHLNHIGRGRVVAAWNGLFFAYDRTTGGAHGLARHVAPVVLRGRVYYHVGNHRWSFGVKYKDGKPAFKTLHLPGRKDLTREYAYAAVGAQCLVREGAPLRIQPVPTVAGGPVARAVASTQWDAGHIAVVDHMKTSRTSMGWSRDSSRLYLLIVKEPDTELESALALRRGQPAAGGWTLDDLQRFWMAKGVWGAVNIDGGGLTQLAALRKGGQYLLLTGNDPRRRIVPETFPNPPGGGALMYFYIRDLRDGR
jgi:hypothetical protein